MADSNGRFVWHELMTSDKPAAEAFYRAVVGWEMRDAGGLGGEPYTLLSAGGADVAGLMALPEPLIAIGRKPAWSGYIAVDDTDAWTAKVLHAGGKVHRPADDIPEVGRFAVVADPQGASFVLFTPSLSERPTQPAVGTPGTVGWNELHAMDGAAAFEFYSTLFGWTKGDAIDMGPAGIYQLFFIDGQPAGGMMTKMPERPAPGWNFYVAVSSVAAATAALRAHGGTVTHGPVQVPGGSWTVNAIDPQGAEISFTSVAA